MTNDLTMPALFSVLVGAGWFPERRVATRHGADETFEVHYAESGWWACDYSTVHDVVEVIPDGTPVDRIVVLPEVGEVVPGSVDGMWLVGEVAYYVNGASAEFFAEQAAETLACWRAIAAEYKRRNVAARSAEPVTVDEFGVRVGLTVLSWGDIFAARAAEPTPDPLAQARERLVLTSALVARIRAEFETEDDARQVGLSYGGALQCRLVTYAPWTDVPAAAEQSGGARCSTVREQAIALRAMVEDHVTENRSMTLPPRDLSLLLLRPEPRVWRSGDAEPGVDVQTVMDSSGDVWQRSPGRSGYAWHWGGLSYDWYMLTVGCAPLVEVDLPEPATE
jgi:hypothetical protein